MNGKLYSFAASIMANVDLVRIARESMQDMYDVVVVSFDNHPNHCIVLIDDEVESRLYRLEGEKELDQFYLTHPDMNLVEEDWTVPRMLDQFEKLGVTFVSPNSSYRLPAVEPRLIHRRWLPAIYKLMKKVKDSRWDREKQGPEVSVLVERQSFA